jgi:hypothetical protein
MSGRYGKQLLDNIRWRQECVARVGLGLTLPENPLLEKFAGLDKFSKQNQLFNKSGVCFSLKDNSNQKNFSPGNVEAFRKSSLLGVLNL